MSNGFLHGNRKNYFGKKICLKRLKNEAKNRNCSVVLYKGNFPPEMSRTLGLEDDQQVPDFMDPSKEHMYPKDSCDTRNIFQSFEAYSGFEKNPKDQQEVKAFSADSLFLIDLGSTHDSTKVEGNISTEEIEKDVKIERLIKEENVVKVDYENVSKKEEDNWCPLTPMSDPGEELLTPNVSENVTDCTKNCIQHNSESNISKMPLITECWSLAGQDSIWSYSCEGTNGSDHMLLSSTYETKMNIKVESNSAVEQSSEVKTEVPAMEQPHIKHDMDEILCNSLEIHKDLTDNIDVNSSHQQSEVCSVIETSSDIDQPESLSFSNDFQKPSTPQPYHEVLSQINTSCSELEQSRNEQSIENVNSDDFDQLQEVDHVFVNVDTSSDANTTQQSNLENGKTIREILSILVDNVVASEETKSIVEVTTSPVQVPEEVNQNPVSNEIIYTSTNIEVNVPVSNVNLPESEISKSNTDSNYLTNNSKIPENDLVIIEESTIKPKEHGSFRVLDAKKAPLRIKRKRGRPKGQGKGNYGNTIIRHDVPYGQIVYNMTNLNTVHEISTLNHTANQHGVNVPVPVELPSKGIIGMVSQATFSEIQKHQNASEQTVPQTVDPTYQVQTMKTNGGILVPIYDPKHLELVQNTIKALPKIGKKVKIPPDVQMSTSNQMMELKRPPPTYHSAVALLNKKMQEKLQSPTPKNPPSVTNQNTETLQLEVGNESVFALPRNAVSNTPVPISIPKSRSNRKGPIIKPPKLTVREQLLRKMKENLSGRMTDGTPSILPKNTAHSNKILQSPSTQHQLAQSTPMPNPLSPPPLLQRQQLPQPPLSQSPLLHPPLSQPTLSQPPLSQPPLSQPSRQFANPPLLLQRPTTPHGEDFTSIYRHHNQIKSNQPFPLVMISPTTTPPVLYNHSFVTAPQYQFMSGPQNQVSRQVTPFVTNPPTVSSVSHSVSAINQVPANTSYSNNIPKVNNLVTSNQTFVNPPPPQDMNSALDLSMPSKKFHSTPPIPVLKQAVPLDLSRKSIPISDAKCTPLDLSLKDSTRSLNMTEHVIQTQNVSDEIVSQPINITSSAEPLQECSPSSEYFNADQNLSVLAAAAEMLEANSFNTSSNDTTPDAPSTSLKMAKLRVKFNQKRKLWHLVPNKDPHNQIDRKPRRGRPPIIRNIKDATGGKIHNCQFCDFSHSLKTEVRIHIKLAHFAKFKKDPKTNKIRKVNIPVNKEGVNERMKNQESKLSSAKFCKELFHCKSCDFKSKARYLLQRHVMKWHPTKSSYMCQSKDCAQMFQTMELLREHQLLHKKNQKYVCNICGASYHYMNGLRAHDARHHALLAHQCPHCGLKFKSQGMLQRHKIQKNHGSVQENSNVQEIDNS